MSSQTALGGGAYAERERRARAALAAAHRPARLEWAMLALSICACLSLTMGLLG